MEEIKYRKDITKLIDKLGLQSGVEIGVNEGAFSEHLLGNSGLRVLYSIDAWTTDTNLTKSVFRKWATRHGEVSEAYETTKKRLSRFGDRSKIVRKLSYDAVHEFDDNQLDFVYVDGCHRFTGVAMDLAQWWPKIKTGGILAGHDYWECYRCEVMEAVNGFSVEHKQILHLTTEDKDCRGRNKYPPTFWLVKTDRSKKQWLKDLEEARTRLLEDQKRLAERGIHVVLPYQYLNQGVDNGNIN